MQYKLLNGVANTIVGTFVQTLKTKTKKSLKRCDRETDSGKTERICDNDFPNPLVCEFQIVEFCTLATTVTWYRGDRG